MLKEATTQLQLLYNHLSAINNDIVLVETPISQMNSLLAELTDLLSKPKTISDDLGKISEILTAVQKVCSEATWMPEIGEAAKTVSELLIPIVKEPPPHGGIGVARNSLDNINKALSPLKEKIETVQSPVKKVLDAIHKVELTVQKLESGVQVLIHKYGAKPPGNVEKCAAGINQNFENIAQQIHQLEEKLDTQAEKFLAPLKNIANALHQADGVLDKIQTSFNELDKLRQPIREMTQAVDKALSYGEEEVEKLFSWAGRHLYPGKYQELKKMLDKANRYVNQLIGKITAMMLDPVKKQLANTESRIKDEVSHIPAVAALEDALSTLEQTLQDLEDRLINFLAGDCAKLFEAS